MKIPMSEGGVPFVVTYRKILRKPKIKRERKFVGITQLVKNLMVKAIEAVEAAAFETTTEYLDEGQSVAVHWALTVEDPFDTRPGVEKSLIAYRMLDDIPPNGLHFEVFMADRKPQGLKSPEGESQGESRRSSELSPEEMERQQRASGPQANFVHDLTPEQFDLLRRRQQNELLRDTRGVNGGFRRPPAPEYGPRPVRTIEDEIAEEADEEPTNLDRPGSQREDD
jgi:hypothetical protein